MILLKVKLEKSASIASESDLFISDLANPNNFRLIKKAIDMLKKIYKALVIARVGSAAAQAIFNMTDRQIADAGIDRRTFPLDAMQRIEAEFAQKDASQAKASITSINLDLQTV